MWLYGYRRGEVVLPALPAQKLGVRIGEARFEQPRERAPVAVSAGLHCAEVAPHPDMYHTDTARAGVSKRVTAQTPEIDHALMNELRQYVEKWCKNNLTPLPEDTDLSVETWLESTKYSLKRKNQLLQVSKTFRDVMDDKRNVKVKSFIKDENYPEFKHARAINSRTDEFKVSVGPIFKKIEKEVFAHKAFIKKIPVADRPKYIMDLLYRVGAKYPATDYRSFECSFVAEVMENVEFVMYRYMTKNLSCKDWFSNILSSVLAGENICDFKYFTVLVPATRMSGEMCTSLGNGFTNLMVFGFVCEKLGIDWDGVVEGDDGLFVVNEWKETTLFRQLGFTIDMVIHDNIETASFCGIVFDVNDMNNLCDVKEVLANMSWLNAKYARARDSKVKALLRCKALSYAHQYPGCPVVQSMAAYVLRMTRSLDVRNLAFKACANEYERETVAEYLGKPVPSRQVGFGSRMIVELKYGVTVESQLRLERYFEETNTITPIPESLTWFLPDDWRKNRMYVRNSNYDPPSFPILYPIRGA